MPTVSPPRSRAPVTSPSKKVAAPRKATSPKNPDSTGKAVPAKPAHPGAEASWPNGSLASLSAAEFSVGLVDADLGPLPSGEVFDEADSAQHIQLRELAEIQRRARQANKPETHPDFDGKHCVECDVAIPSARLLLQKVRCVDCQRDLEEARGRVR